MADFHGLLGAQDAGGWRPHVTIQNKVPAKEARALISTLERDFRPRPIAIHGLGLHRYSGGALGRCRDLSLPRPLAQVTDPVAAEFEGREAGFENRGKHGLLH
jgi:hypothetical protein